MVENMVEWVEWYMESNNALFATFPLSPPLIFFVLNLDYNSSNDTSL